MVTGRAKFPKFTAGHMIMAKMEEILFPKRNRSVQMNKGIDFCIGM
jgi:hypothetical protein